MPIPPCWNTAEVTRTIKPDAEEISDHVFRAVHCQADLHLSDTSNGPRIPFPPEKFVDRFLANTEQDMLCVVVGESGKIVTSSDGTSWDTVSFSSLTTDIWGIARGGTTWVAVGASGTISTIVDDDDDFTSRTSGTTESLRRVFYKE